MAKQVAKDVIHSLRYLSKKGTIVLHDCNPRSEERQIEFYKKGKKWNGTVWKAFVRFRMKRKDLRMYVVDVDHGMGIIQKGKQKCFPFYSYDKLTWDFLARHRREVLNLCSVNEFLRMEN